MAIITEQGTNGESFSVDPDRREFSFTAVDGSIYKRDLLPVTEINYSPGIGDGASGWINIGVMGLHSDYAHWSSVPVTDTSFWERFVATVQTVIALRQDRYAAGMNDVDGYSRAVIVGERFKCHKTKRIFSVCDVSNDNVKLQDVDTMYMYEVPMTLLSNQGHFLSLSYRFPY
jgi:hypothetical protein